MLLCDFLPSCQQKDKKSEVARQIFPLSTFYSVLTDFMQSQKDYSTIKISRIKHRCGQTIKPMFILCAFWFSFLGSLMCFCIGMTLCIFWGTFLLAPFLSCPGSFAETITASTSGLIYFPARTGSTMKFGAFSALCCGHECCLCPVCKLDVLVHFFCASYISRPNICCVKGLFFCVSHTLQPWQRCKYWRLVVLTERAVGQDVGPRCSCVIAADLTRHSNCERLCEPLCGSSQLRMQTALKWRLRM